MSRKLLILGSRSFVGSELASVAEELHVPFVAWSSADCDLRDRAQVQLRFAEIDPADKITLVFCAVKNKSDANSFGSYQENVAMAENVASLLPSCVQHVIYLSSVDVYGFRPSLPITEATPIRPDTWYALAKFASEWIVQHECAVPVTVLRIPGIFGPSIRDRSAIGAMIASAKQHGKIVVGGDGAPLRDYVYSRDLARFILAVAKTPVSSTFNVASGSPQSIAAIAEEITKQCFPAATIESGEADQSRDFSLIFDTTALKSAYPEFKFNPLAAGIRAYIPSPQ